MRFRPIFTVPLLLIGALALVAAAEQPASYVRDIEPILVKACGDCHGAEDPKKGLDLSQGHGYANLVDRKSQEVLELALVKAGDANASYLWHKLSHNAEKGRGMPRTLFGAKQLPQEQRDLVQRWIQEGAKP